MGGGEAQVDRQRSNTMGMSVPRRNYTTNSNAYLVVSVKLQSYILLPGLVLLYGLLGHPFQDGDDTIQMPLATEDHGFKLRTGYVKALIDIPNGSACPILSVLATDPGYHKEVKDVENPQYVKLAYIHLVDEDGDQIHAHLNISLFEVCCMLKHGNKTCLNMFIPLWFQISPTSPHMPSLIIHRLSHLGNYPLPDNKLQPAIIP